MNASFTAAEPLHYADVSLGHAVLQMFPIYATYVVVGGDYVGDWDQQATAQYGNLTVGRGVDSSGSYEQNVGSVTVASDLYVGYEGSGRFYQNAAVTTDRLLLAGNSVLNCGRASGTYELIAGNLTSRTEEVGFNGDGIFNHDSGTNNLSQVLQCLGP